ncbi:hypothetical protein [Endomicrobium proavitum]|uniref:Uncharacterized protein n=1 Tax=Endomicrobium proavitum TaxID=1408281 RepID=A0A0G3WGW2_9BACT|nr:hypothetical protein [Endomicrobium proavitum]AKL97911.1 hypothetical protein Epro_0532 [Endomicrobium proavitum]
MRISLFKKLSAFVFAADILAGVIVGIKLYPLAGIVTVSVLLIINVVFYAIILKILKAGENATGR